MSNNKRTIELTHKQIEIICHALNNTSNQALDKYGECCQFTNKPNEEKKQDFKPLFDIYMDYSELSADIKNGSLDV